MRLEREKQRILIVFMIAFIAGILYANIVAERYATVTGVFHQGLLDQYISSDVASPDYFVYLTKCRLLPLAVVGIAATTNYRKVCAVLFLAWTGFAGGLLAVISVLRMGGIGMLLYLVALLPHYPFYILGYALIIWYCLKTDVKWNAWKTGTVFLTFGAGIMLEAYLNPWMLRVVFSVFL